MNRRRIVRLAVIASGTVALAAAAHAAPKRAKTPLPKPRPTISQLAKPTAAQLVKAAASQAAKLLSPAPLSILPAALTATTRPAAPADIAALAYARPDQSLVTSPSDNTPPSDIALVKQAGELVRKNRFGEASALKASIRDSVAVKLVEWMILRGDDDHSPGFERYAAFVSENPSWPSVGLLRKRAEAALWDDNRDAATVIGYFTNNKPRSAKGSFALARALAARGDRDGAERHVREAWQQESFSSAIERMVLEMFSGVLRPVDHRIRMHRRFYAEDIEGGMRSAYRLGEADRAIAKAWAAVNRKAKNAPELLNAVPEGARRNPGYLFALARWQRRAGKTAEAAQILISAPREAGEVIEPDDWWIERRLVARTLIEAGEHQMAYRVAATAAVPDKSNYRVDRDFTAGWIALRFLQDPATASRHFAAIAGGTRNPTALARAGYWLGRAAEASGRSGEARTHYAAAGRYRTTYYGQLARAKLGENDIALPETPAPSRAMSRLELVRALGIVYAAGERDLAIPFVADLADRVGDTGALVAMAEITQQNRDARATMLLGKVALNEGHPLAKYAFPTIGVPSYQAIGPEVDSSLVYSIVRQESAFNQKTVSIANALGLMQVTPPAGRYIARKFNVSFDHKRLLNDSTYNVQMGAAELGDLIRDYRGSYILAFVGYNAGRGRVRDWIARFGDPRDPNVDPVDWVEKIPFAETRNYVQRIIENVQVYRARFGASRRLTIEADMRGGNAAN